MKLGFVSAILDGWTFEEMIDTASEMGFSCVEVACWPQGRAERRYAGVSHIDVDSLSDEKAAYILNYCKERKVEISSLAYYPNTLDGNLEKRACVVEHLKNVIRASHKLGVNMVTTFIGRDQTKSVEQNLALVKEVWPPIIALAEELAELQQAVAEDSNIEEELGDLLFAAVKVARFFHIDAEEALAGTCEKFIRRFSGVEAAVTAQGRTMHDLDVAQLMALWNREKHPEQREKKTREGKHQ